MECVSAGNPILEYVSWIIAFTRQSAGDDGIALCIFTVTSVGLLLAMKWANSLAVPPAIKLINNFLDEQLQKARRIYEENRQYGFQGIRLVTVQIAVLFGFASYLWTKIAIKILHHWPWTVSLLLLLVFGFLALGRWHSPRLRLRGYRFLLLSAGSGIALGVVTIVLDAFTGLLALAVASMVS